MDKKTKWLIIAAGVLVLSLITNIIQFYDLHNKTENVKIETKTKVVVKHDTLTFNNPMPYEVKTTETVIKKIPVDKIVHDTAYVELAKETKKYEKDSVYECQISGIEPNLDYIKVFPKTVTVTNEITKTITKTKRPHFNWGLQTGVGYGVLKKNLDVYVGVGAQYSF